jgi:hypothetical protein
MEPKSPTSIPARIMARMFAEFLPSARAEEQLQSREAVQTSAWLVGLSAALLTFAAANHDLVNNLGTRANATLVAVLASACIAGVTHRILESVQVRRTTSLLYRLSGFLSGLRESDEAGPTPPESVLTRADVIKCLADDFNLDYAFLDEYNVSVERCKSIHRDVFNREVEYDKELGNTIKLAIEAHTGITFESPKVDFNDVARERHSTIICIRKASTVAYVITTVSFLTGVALISGSLLDGTS